MSSDIHIPEKAVPTVDSAPDPAQQTPTTTYYQGVVDDFSKGFNVIIAALPDVGLTAAHPSTEKFVRTHQNVPLAFLASAIAAVEQTSSLQGTEAFDTVESRNTLQFLEAFTPLAERVTAFRNTLVYTIMTKKAELAAKCLQVYDVSKGLTRHAGASAGPISLATHVHTMKHNLGKKATRRKAQPPPSTPEVPEPHGNAAQA